MSLAVVSSFSTFMVYSALSLTLALGIYQLKIINMALFSQPQVVVIQRSKITEVQLVTYE